MDIVSHSLWGGLAFGRKNRPSFFLAFIFGAAPDLFSFGILWLANWLGFLPKLDFSAGPPAMSAIPSYVHALYNITHSLFIFLLAFAVVWLLARRPVWEMSAWGLHIVFDIFTHSREFFPTPFLWPFFDYRLDAVNWTHPAIFIPNLAALVVLYLCWLTFIFRRVK